MSDKIPIAEEFLLEYDKSSKGYNEAGVLKDFAKLHVKAALEDAKNNAQLCLRKYPIKSNPTEEEMGQEISTEREQEYYGISGKSILEAYPESKIV